MSTKIDNMTEIHEEDFYNLEHPDNPYVEIQFKTGVSTHPDTDEKIWTSVTLHKNYFDTLTITDSSGFYNMDLYLKDRDFINLENIVLRTIAASRISNYGSFYNDEVGNIIMNSIVDENKTTTTYRNGVAEQQGAGETVTTTTKKTDEEISQEAIEKQFQFYIDKNRAECIRIRFGHSLKSNNNSIKSFKGRTKQKKGTVIVTDWIYFMLLNINYNIDSNGSMSFLFKGISTTRSYFDNAKLMVNGGVIKGTPRHVWQTLKKYIEKASNNQIILQDGSAGGGTSDGQGSAGTPDFFSHQEDVKEITLNTLYEKIRTIVTDKGEERIISFKSLRQLFDDYVNLLKPIYRTKDGAEIKSLLSEDPSEAGHEVHHIDKPKWMAIEEKAGDLKYTKIILYYASPMSSANTQTIKRVYTWKDAPKSLVKTLNISTNNDFAMLNAPMRLTNKDEQTEIINLRSNSYGGATEFNNRVNYVKQLKEGLGETSFINADGFMTAQAFKTDNYETIDKFIEALINNINDSVFKGEIEIPLDPFYLFDNEMLPYVYMIKLDINRPTRFDSNNNIKLPTKSYLSGNYLISKITHTISHDNATTKLEVTKFPDVAENYNENAEILSKGKKEQNRKAFVEAAELEIQEFDKKLERLESEIDRLKSKKHTAELGLITTPAWKYQKQIDQKQQEIEEVSKQRLLIQEELDKQNSY